MQTNAKAFACNKAFLAFAINKKPEIGFLFIAARLYGAIAFLSDFFISQGAYRRLLFCLKILAEDRINKKAQQAV